MSAFLTQNLHCPGSDGVVVGASGITIDLKSFRLRGDDTPAKFGIDDSGGFGKVDPKWRTAQLRGRRLRERRQREHLERAPVATVAALVLGSD